MLATSERRQRAEDDHFTHDRTAVTTAVPAQASFAGFMKKLVVVALSKLLMVLSERIHFSITW